MFDPIKAQDILRLLRINIPAIAYGKGKFDTVCPFCDDHSKHLNINIDKSVYCCRRCGEGGSLVQLYGRLHTPPLSDYREICDEIRANTTGNIEDSATKKEVVRHKPTPLASVEDRDKAYRALLSLCNLKAAHRSNLMRRGISYSEIRQYGYKSTPDADMIPRLAQRVMETSGLETLEGIPGFYLDKRSEWAAKAVTAGYFVPYLDENGLIQGMQIRTDPKVRAEYKEKHKGSELGKYIWLTSSNVPKGGSKGTTVPSFVHMRGKPTEYVILTEGGLKADAAYSLMDGTYSFLAIAGVNSTKCLESALKTCKKAGVRRIMVALDMDMHQNGIVLKAAGKIRELIVKHGMEVSALQWEQGKGIDDFLISQSRNEALQIREFEPFF